jgi:hypothetical protein
MAAHLPALKSAIIFSFIYNVMTTLGLLAFLIDYADMVTDFTIKVK